MELYVVSIFKVNKNIPCVETGLELKLSSLLSYVLKKKNLSMLGVYFADSWAWKAQDTNPLKKKSVNGEKLYFMKVILLYLVLEKLVFGAFQNVGSTTVFFLVHTAFSKKFLWLLRDGI